MTVTNDIEKDTKANFAVAEVVDNSASATPTLTEASIYGNESAMAKTATVVTVERSPLELATAVDTEESDKRKADLCCGSCCDVSSIHFVLCGFSSVLYCRNSHIFLADDPKFPFCCTTFPSHPTVS